MEQKNAISRRLFFGGTLACGAATLLKPSVAFADPASEKQAEADAAYATLIEKQEALDRASNNYHKAVQAQEEAQDLMEDARQRIAGESARIAEYQEQLSMRAHDMYRAGTGSFLDVLLGASSFEEFANNWEMLNTMNASDAALVKRSKESRQAMANAKATYEVQKQTATKEAAEAKTVHDEAMATVAEMEAVYESLSEEAAVLVAERNAAQATITDQATLAQLAEEGAAATAEWEAASQSAVQINDAAAPQEEQAAPAQESTPAAPEPEPEPAPEPEPEPEPEPVWEPEPEPEPEPEYYEPVVDYNVDFGSRVVNVALQYLGWDYVWGGKSPASGGFDCSGFVSYCYGQAGSYAPAWTGSLIGWGYEVWDPQPGDVCVIHEESGKQRQHTGIYYGGGQMIHAATFGVGVIISSVQEGMTYRRGY